jgi:hypothetical protein
MGKSTFYNGETYVDTMNKNATMEFINATHKKYKTNCKEHFGKNIKGIFTDEPHRGAIMCGFGIYNANPGFLTPYTDDLFKKYIEMYNEDLIELLPELFLWKDGQKISPIKWKYVELLQTLFIENFMIPIQKWCQENDIIYTGHLLHEDSLTAQTCMLGSVIRTYEYFDYPGVDVLTENNKCYWIVKQAQSVVRQLGKKNLVSELYGVTGWQFDFEGHKAVGDWQALFGVDFRCHHLSWYSMAGESKRDYPASISHQSAWFQEYKYIEDYFSRINVFMSDGISECDVLIVNPIESLWAQIYANWSEGLQTKDSDILEIEKIYRETFLQLVGECIDFDYGDEDFIKKMASIEIENYVTYLRIGNCRYRKVVITGMRTIRSSTVNLLKDFVSQGGTVIISGFAPDYVDAVKSDAVNQIGAAYAEPSQLANMLTESRFVTITYKNDNSPKEIFAQVCKRENDYIIMLLNTNREKEYKNVKVSFAACGYCENWNPRNGEISLICYGDSFVTDFLACEEKLIVLTQKNNRRKPFVNAKETRQKLLVNGPFKYSLTEPNVCVLDFVDYKINNEKWVLNQEILKADQQIRSSLNMPVRSNVMHQPWFELDKKHQEFCDLTISYSFDILIMPKSLKIAIESPEEFNILINEKSALRATDYRWVDKCFCVFDVDVSVLKYGKNNVTIAWKFRSDINLEAIYLLGDFGVDLAGINKTLVELPSLLSVGDISKQGLPFYGAGIKYYLDVPNNVNSIGVDNFEAALIKVMQKEKTEIIAMQPYIASLEKGETVLEYILTRRNTFGPLHADTKGVDWIGPDQFITTGDAFFGDKHILLPQGMTSQPYYFTIH